MLDRKNSDFPIGIVDGVIDEIGIATCHQISHAVNDLAATGARNRIERPKRFQDRVPDPERGRRTVLLDVIGNVVEVGRGSLRQPVSHTSKRRNAAATSSSVANSLRLA